MSKQPNQAVDWNNEAIIAIVKDGWRDGLSYSQIAKLIPGATRNSVAGKVHRLGLPLRTKKVRLKPPNGNGDKHPPAAAKRVA
jgi:hypothetical protein